MRSPGASASLTASAVDAADLAVGVLQAAHRDLERRGLVEVGQRDADRARLLAEEPRPGLAPGDGLLGHQLLLRLAEQVRAVAADRAQVVAHVLQAVRLDQRVGGVVVDLRPLEVEEHELRLDRGGELGRPLRRARRWPRPRCRRRSAGGRSSRRAPTRSAIAPSSAIAVARPAPSSSATRPPCACANAAARASASASRASQAAAPPPSTRSSRFQVTSWTAVSVMPDSVCHGAPRAVRTKISAECGIDVPAGLDRRRRPGLAVKPDAAPSRKERRPGM